jgi:HEAT repeat protein
MLVEGPDGHHLYLFSSGGEPVQALDIAIPNELFASAFAKTRSADPRVRTRGLTELAGVPDAEALDIALTLLTDPSPTVRSEASQLILDHPQGASLAKTLGLVDEDEED